MKNIYDKGVPTKSNILIRFDQLLKECVKPDLLDKVYEEFGDEAFKDLSFTFSSAINRKLAFLNSMLCKNYVSIATSSYMTVGINDDLNRYLTVHNNNILLFALLLLGNEPENKELSESELISKIRDSLKKIHFNYKSQIENYESLNNLYKDIVESQRRIKVELDTYKKIKMFTKIEGFLANTNTTEIEKNIKSLLSDLNKFGFYENVSVKDVLSEKVKIAELTPAEFSKYIKVGINKLINEYEVIKHVANNVDISMELLDDYLDLNKVELLIACLHLNKAITSKENRTQNLSYVTTYLEENRDSLDDDLSIKFTFNGEEEVIITKSELNSKYINFLINHPEVPIINATSKDYKGKSLSKINKEISDLESSIDVDFDFLVADDDSYNTRDSLEVYKRSLDTITDEEKKALIDAKIRILEEKLAFFEEDKKEVQEEIITNDKGEEETIRKEVVVSAPGKTNLAYKIYGKNKFAGYIGYVYGSGTVVLEKFFKDNGLKTTDNYAMYIMDIKDFLTLTQKSPKEIIANKLCDRIPHTTNWQDRAMKIIAKKSSIASLKTVQDFKKALTK